MNKKILLIDDEAEFIQLIKMNLDLTTNFIVDTAVGGKQGLKLAKKIKPDIIVLDVNMPGMDGFEVLKRLKADKSTMNIFVIMLSGRLDDEAIQKSAEFYNEMYLTKPIEAKDLIESIIKVLKRRHVVGDEENFRRQDL